MSVIAGLLSMTLVVCATARWGDSALHPQDGPHADVTLIIDDDGVRVDIAANLVMLDEMFTAPRESPDAFDTGEEEIFADAAAAFLISHHPVAIDGVTVEPVVANIQFHPPNAALVGLFPRFGLRGLARVSFTATYPTVAPPESVSMTWTTFPPDVAANPDDPPPLTIPAEVHDHGRRSMIRFTPNEPQFIWHAATDPGLDGELAIPVPPEPTPPLSTQQWVFSSGGTIMAILLAVLFFREANKPRSKRPRLARFAAWAWSLSAAMIVTGTWVIPTPGGESIVSSSEEASAIFQPLHANIYDAFGHLAKSDVYDALEQSVDGPLLDELYRTMHRSLIMKEHGGAVALVEAVRVTTFSLDDAGMLQRGGDSVTGFQCTATWEVDGVVSHWGHTHEQTNQYVAEFLIQAVPEAGWRITDVLLLDQQRLFESGPDEPPQETDPGPVEF
jgi:hypothetical protein